MHRKLLLAAAAAGLLAVGCDTLKQVAASLRAQPAAQLAQQHLAENLEESTRVSKKDVIIAAETLAHAKGFDCREDREAAGFDGIGLHCRCEKRQDRGRTAKEHVTVVTFRARRQWAPDGSGDARLTTYGVGGREYDVDQDDREDGSLDFDSARVDHWTRDLQALLSRP